MAFPTLLAERASYIFLAFAIPPPPRSVLPSASAIPRSATLFSPASVISLSRITCAFDRTQDANCFRRGKKKRN
jgi:hypothetical protein